MPDRPVMTSGPHEIQRLFVNDVEVPVAHVVIHYRANGTAPPVPLAAAQRAASDEALADERD